MSIDYDYDKEMAAMARDFELESRRNRKAAIKLAKADDLVPYIEDDRVTPYADLEDLAGTFSGKW